MHFTIMGQKPELPGQCVTFSMIDTKANSMFGWKISQPLLAVDLHRILPSLCMQEVTHSGVAQSNTVK